MRYPLHSNPRSPSWSHLPATAGVVVSTVLLAGLTYAAWRALRGTHAGRKGSRPAGQAEDLTRWEGEGGGVPVGGSRTAAEMNAGVAGLGSSTATSPATGTSTGTGLGGPGRGSTGVGTGLGSSGTGSSGNLPH